MRCLRVQKLHLAELQIMLEVLHGTCCPHSKGLCWVCLVSQSCTQPPCHHRCRPACHATLPCAPPESLHQATLHVAGMLAQCAPWESTLASLRLHAGGWSNTCRHFMRSRAGGCMQCAYLDDQDAAADAAEAAAGVAHAQRGLQLCGGRRAPCKAPSVPALYENRHPPAIAKAGFILLAGCGCEANPGVVVQHAAFPAQLQSCTIFFTKVHLLYGSPHCAGHLRPNAAFRTLTRVRGTRA